LKAVRVGDAGRALIKHFEGVYRRPYLCPAFLWTVGVGRVLYPEQIKLKVPERKLYPLKPEHDREWTDAAIDLLLDADLLTAESGVLRLCPDSALSQGQFDALVAFSFNVGTGALQASTLRRKYNAGDVAGAAEEFVKWNKGGGRVLVGLTRRRLAEQALFLSKGA
jgi:lysozyme